ncbi:MAG: US12 family protein [Bacilli bacterium]|nr:US12 family protein [Bacilli bacterium]
MIAESIRQSDVKTYTTTKWASKVFLYMFMAIGITAVVCAVIGLIFTQFFPIVYGNEVNIDAAKAYIGLFIAAFIMYIPLILWIHFSVFKEKSRPMIPFVLYAIVMGVFISGFTMFVPFYLIAISFGLTCFTFGIMFVIGWFTKRDLSILGMIGFGMMIGILFIGLFNVIWMLFFPGFEMIYWVISYGMFAAMLLITIFDINRVKRIADSGEQSNKTAILCAFNLYVDFIYIFIRILSIVVRIYGRSRN